MTVGCEVAGSLSRKESSKRFNGVHIIDYNAIECYQRVHANKVLDPIWPDLKRSCLDLIILDLILEIWVSINILEILEIWVSILGSES